MITLSEALSNFSGTTNYVAKYTPTGNVLGISQIFDNGTNVGIGTATPTSKLQIVGIDSTSSNYSLKVDNSLNNPLFHVRNDGYLFSQNSHTNNVSTLQLFNTDTGIGFDFKGYYGRLSLGVVNTTVNATLSLTDYGTVQNFINFDSDGLKGYIGGLSGGITFVGKQSGSQRFIISSDDGFLTNLGFRTWFKGRMVIADSSFSTTAQLHIQGTDSTSSNYSLKVDNSSSSPLFYVRNDGYLSIGYNSVSNASLYIQGKALATGTDAIRVNSLALGTIFAVEDYLPRVNIQASYTTRPSTLTLGNNAGTQGYIGFNNNAELGWIYSSSNNGIRLEFNNKSTLNTDIYLHSDPAILTYGNSYVSASFRYNTQIGFNDVLTDYFTRLYVKGVDSTSSYYSLKIDNLANNPLFYVRNDGLILANNLPTSASGLPSGAIWNNGGILNII